MSQQLLAILRGSLSGTTEGGSLAPTTFDYRLSSQDTHGQDVITVETGDVLKPVQLPVAPQQVGTKQTLFMMVTTGNVQARLNENDSLIFNLSPNGPFILPGLPEIGKVEFTSLAAEEVKVSIHKVFGANSNPDPSGGYVFGAQLDKFAATAGQTDFTLTRSPGGVVLLFVEGIQYSSPTFFSVSGTTLTWLNAFPLIAGTRVEVYYS